MASDSSAFQVFLRQQIEREQAPVYKPIRRLSTRLSWRLAKAKVRPNVLTVLGALSALGAATLLAHGPRGPMLGAAALIAFAYLFDCMDGEVARAGGFASALGGQLDQLSNWVTLVALQIGLALGAGVQSGNSSMAIWGMFAIAGWCTFYYLYLQLANWVPGDGRFVLLRTLSRILFMTMPLDENLVLLAALTGRAEFGIVVSAVLSMTLSLVVCAAFIAGGIASAREARPANDESMTSTR
ncbi:CDP-alcohol phosphatidyltransferase [Burkholderia ambifaria IOP40-10]|uniref:CDP-alcohol phosphatidyltransferase n=1 Tax=Burkholderia ambifaria IOP40-10 TaxID=396596 RepID=B1FH52_9BURK|nr:CDP-alcohol phosphatidyltransferase family protein [Burkholderia ambifaria]EDT03136.1 CDP-alcohol phosphatidyltransferase [Burkholderia ambifaria IOP40-10]